MPNDLNVNKRRVAPMGGAIVRNLVASASGNVGDIVTTNADYGQRPASAATATPSIVTGIVTAVGCEGATSFVAGDALSVVTHGPVCGVTPAAAGLAFLSDTPGKIADGAGTVRRVVGSFQSPEILYINPIND